MSALKHLLDRYNEADKLTDLETLVVIARDETAAEELATLREANTHSVELLKTAKDLLDGTHNLCDVVDSEEWLWKWRVRYYLGETDIPVHEMPQDMRDE